MALYFLYIWTYISIFVNLPLARDRHIEIERDRDVDIYESKRKVIAIERDICPKYCDSDAEIILLCPLSFLRCRHFYVVMLILSGSLYFLDSYRAWVEVRCL